MQERKRLFLGKKTNDKERIEIIKWAATNNYDAIVFSLGERLTANNKYIKLAKRYNLLIEAGGHDFPVFMPTQLFLFHRNLFRMEQGKRKKHPHFCPTNPKTIAVIKKHSLELFARTMQALSVPRVFHLLPDKGHETKWCTCPACRAFSPAEQNIIAVNSAADALAGLDSEARLSFFDYGAEVDAARVAPRENMFKLKM